MNDQRDGKISELLEILKSPTSGQVLLSAPVAELVIRAIKLLEERETSFCELLKKELDK